MGAITSFCNQKFLPGSTLTLPRRPTHIGVVVTGTRGNRASVSPRELATLVVWCVAGGVSFITVYDALGTLGGVTLLDEIVRRHKEILRADWSKFPLEIVDSRWKTCSQKYTGGTAVALVAPGYGRACLAAVAKSFCHKVAKHQQWACDLQVDQLETSLQASLPGFPDPDLVLRLGPVQSTLGYLPWHLRISEIIPMHSITYSNFLEALHTFAACQPRFGK
uniref:dehydrodolichyl diphosphate synthase complex subunit NUS1 n=1 Tax=Myxine glutinosa TaxID=7769 RepID=UPI00358E071E